MIGNHMKDNLEGMKDLAQKAKSEYVSTKGSEFDGIPNGGHDAFLTKLTGWLRGQCGLSEEALFRLLCDGPTAVLKDTNPDNPYTQSDMRRIARSMAVKPGSSDKPSDPQFEIQGAVIQGFSYKL